ncbi:MAG TPA: AMP-dependent synthetase/ligase [Actinomycetales bacterium]
MSTTPVAARHLVDVLGSTVAVDPQKALFARRTAGGFEDVTAAAFAEQVRALAKGFVAAGVEVGDRVGIMSKTRYEWTLADFALWTAGAVGVPIYETSSPAQVAWILSDADAVGCVVETSAHVTRVSGVRDELPQLRDVWAIEGDGLTALAATGTDVPDDELTRRQDQLTPDSLATLIYTSGTTGRPKGCMLTHGNFIAECSSAVEHLPELFEPEDASTLLFLPLAHVFGRMIQVAVIMRGVKLSHSDPARLVKDLAATSPTFVLSVPQVFEKIYETARRKAVADGKGRIFERAAAVASQYSRALEDGGPGLLLRGQHALFDRLVYTKLRAAFGGKAQWAVSGGAPLGARMGHFFRGIGITVFEGYGLTETTAAAAANHRVGTRIGTVGKALPRFELKVADDGEILIRGGHVFTGYWRDESATREVLDADGWFHSGDLGTLDADGFLTITGRSKEIIVTAGGKNVAPAALEDVLRAHPVVAQAMVVGDRRTYVAALVTVDQESLDAWLAEQGRPSAPVAELTDDPQLRAAVQGAVDAANETVSGPEQVKRFRILASSWTEDSGHLTPTLKLKRTKVMADFAQDVEGLYGSSTGAGGGHA